MQRAPCAADLLSYQTLQIARYLTGLAGKAIIRLGCFPCIPVALLSSSVESVPARE